MIGYVIGACFIASLLGASAVVLRRAARDAEKRALNDSWRRAGGMCNCSNCKRSAP